jgi:competence protein ComEC
VFAIVISFVPVLDVTGTTFPKLVVSYINVGEGLSILVQFPNGKVMLYDAGPQKASSSVLSYLRNRGIRTIDVLIASHPDSDHIGGMDEAIRTFSIGFFYMPKVIHNTQSYLDVLTAAKAKGLTIKTAQKGVTIAIDPSVKVTMWGPVKAYPTDDTNDWSAVVSVSYGNTSFLFTGDAETKAENDMLSAGVVKPKTVLQVGHHGSK